jgi:1-deoxyxylulose-5-phosphate synthase
MADMLYMPLTADSDKAIIDAVGAVAEVRGATRAQSLLHGCAPTPSSRHPWSEPALHLRSTMRSRRWISPSPSTRLGRLEAPYTARYDFQGISDDAVLREISSRVPQLSPAAS